MAEPSMPPAHIITAVEPFTLTYPVTKPGTSQVKTKHSCGVLLRTERGPIGVGLSGMHSIRWPGISDGVLEVVRSVLVGRDACRVRELWRALAESKLDQVPSNAVPTRAMLDIALWDILAQSLDRPLHAILGTARSTGPATYLTIGDPCWSDGDLLSAVCEATERGWRAVKVKVGRSDPCQDAARLRAIRAAIGHDITLMADATQLWSEAQAVRFCRGVEDVGLLWLEEPCRYYDVAAHRSLRRRTGVPLAVGENLHLVSQFREFAEAEAVDIVQPDVTRLAGITEWLTVAGLASAYGLAVASHHSEFGQVHQHCALACDSVSWLEFPWHNELFAEPVRQDGNGRIVQPTGPGAGTRLREEVLAMT
ncbi:MAG: mandelate racemase/muconate lactonizing enzyme family protein [Jatrophihabitantaceae bacterium]